MTVGAPEHAMPTQAPDIPLPDPMAAWLRHLESNRRYSPHTLDGYRRELRFLIELAERAKLPLDKLANGHIRQFVARLHAQGRGPVSYTHLVPADLAAEQGHGALVLLLRAGRRRHHADHLHPHA